MPAKAGAQQHQARHAGGSRHPGKNMRIGILSDTHGHLSEAAFNALKGSDAIVHAGDVGGPEILTTLSTIAPVKCVRGNTDGGPWASSLPLRDLITFNGHHLYLLHDLTTLDLDPNAADISIVVSGHTHQPLVQTIRDVLYFNPGSASQRRHGGLLSVGRIAITANGLRPEIINLDD
jgi:putative phosphoesterase